MRIRVPSITPATPQMGQPWIYANSAAILVFCSMDVGKLGDGSADRFPWMVLEGCLRKTTPVYQHHR